MFIGHSLITHPNLIMKEKSILGKLVSDSGLPQSVNHTNPFAKIDVSFVVTQHSIGSVTLSPKSCS